MSPFSESLTRELKRLIKEEVTRQLEIRVPPQLKASEVERIVRAGREELNRSLQRSGILPSRAAPK